jgi:polyphosphate glucokinase
MKDDKTSERILAIDIGGSNIKATVLSRDGSMLMDYEKIETPSKADPANIIGTIEALTKRFESYDKVSVGFPGFVRNGIVFTAPNLGTGPWKGVELSKLLTEKLKKPVRLLNDADLQGLGVVKGKGLEMAITLGTGFGTALLLNGILLPHLELAHHPIRKEKDYDAYIGEKALEEIGLERWNQRIQKVIKILETVFNYDHLYIGGGNSRKINFKLADNITLVTNKDGIRGGARLWQTD